MKIFLILFFIFSGVYSQTELQGKMVSPVTGLGDAKKQTIGIFISIPAGSRVYGPNSTNSGYPPSIEWGLKENLENYNFLWPKEEDDEFHDVPFKGYSSDILIPIEIEIKDTKKPLSLKGHISYLMCNNTCNPQTMPFELTIPPGPQNASDQAYLFDDVNEEEFQKESILLILSFAFLGGFILNFMPCVLPVLSLKMMGLSAKTPDKKTFQKSAFITFIGIVFSFLILGMISYFFKLSGDVLQWGTQFQNPYFLIFTISIIFFFTANLWGLFEIGQNIVYRIPVINKKSMIADLWNGFIAVFLATPCSAPFLGTALSFTLTQPLPTIFIIFACMGIGFGLPYLLLSIIPPQYIPLPKPGVWMKHFKNILGWGMYLTGIWFIWILSDHIDFLPLLMLLPILILVRKKQIFYVSLFAFLISCTVFLIYSPETEYISQDIEKKIQGYIQKNKIVITKVTAKWCLNCKILDHQIINIPEIKNNSKIKILTLDWTKPNTQIKQYLQTKNRLGIPLIVVYGPGNKKGVTLSEFPSKSEVLDAIKTVDKM